MLILLPIVIVIVAILLLIIIGIVMRWSIILGVVIVLLLMMLMMAIVVVVVSCRPTPVIDQVLLLIVLTLLLLLDVSKLLQFTIQLLLRWVVGIGGGLLLTAACSTVWCDQEGCLVFRIRVKLVFNFLHHFIHGLLVFLFSLHALHDRILWGTKSALSSCVHRGLHVQQALALFKHWMVHVAWNRLLVLLSQCCCTRWALFWSGGFFVRCKDNNLLLFIVIVIE